MPTVPAAILAPALLCACVAAAHAADLPIHTLDNGTVRATVTHAIGGRLLSFGLAGKPNFLKVDTAAGNPDDVVDAGSRNVAWFGHEVWAGPQKAWWSRQDIDPARAGTSWPPDPYLSQSRYMVEEDRPDAVTLASPASPVNGLQLVKRYALVPGSRPPAGWRAFMAARCS